MAHFSGAMLVLGSVDVSQLKVFAMQSMNSTPTSTNYIFSNLREVLNDFTSKCWCFTQVFMEIRN